MMKRPNSNSRAVQINGLYAIVDNSFSPQWSHLELASMFLLGGCKVIQLRIKNDEARDLLWNDGVFQIAKQLIELKDKYDFTLIINDYVDVAAEAGADGVHVGANDMAVDEIRKRVGENLLIGYSSHSVEEAVAAEKLGADYVAFGAIYSTKTKGPGHPVQGISRLKELVSKLSAPTVAIGGIGWGNIDEVLSTEVSSVAMITGLTQAENIVKETKWFVERIDSFGRAS